MQMPAQPEGLLDRARQRLRRRGAMRDAAVLAHRWVGLCLTLFLVVAGLTGTLLAFNEELDAWVSPELRAFESPDSHAELLSPLEVRQRLQAVIPDGARVDRVPLHRERGRLDHYWIDLPAALQDTAPSEYFVDPYTGKVVMSRRWGELGQGPKGWMPFVYRLHYTLGLGEVGAALFGVAALLWTLDCFVGAYLTFPPARRADASPRSWSSWGRAWMRAWRLKIGKLMTLVFTGHRAGGLWVWGLLFVFAWSAVGFNLNPVFAPVMRTLGTSGSPWDELQPKASRHRPAMSWEQGLQCGRTQMDAYARERNFEVLGETELTYDGYRAAYRYAVTSDLDVSEPGWTTLWIEADRCRVLGFEAATGRAAGDTISAWLFALHMARVRALGEAYRWAVAILGLVVAMLSATGVWIWWRKRHRRPYRSTSSTPKRS